jgi:hypothetical protein
MPHSNHPVVVLVLFAAIAGAQPPSTSPPAPAETQQILNLIATPRLHPAGTPTVPAPTPGTSFASWTPEQQKLIPAEVLGRCTTFVGMMSDHGPVHLLPAAQDIRDNNKLAMDLCTAANLPADWPGHAATLTDIQRILRRSTQLGEPLTLPPNLATPPTP